MQINPDELLQHLESNSIVSQIIEITIDETANRSFYKIRCKLIPSEYKLQIKLINTPDDFLYSYQLYSVLALIRWDNSPHFPDIPTFPHHFHSIDGTVVSSEVLGENIIDDLNFILAEVALFITREYSK